MQSIADNAMAASLWGIGQKLLSEIILSHNPDGKKLMASKGAKSTVVAFKVEDELANFLNQLPNKSEFIRRAIYSQLGVACPLCRGTGSVSKSTHDHFESFLQKFDLHQCECCGDEFALPKDASDAIGSLREQMESVRAGGPQFCYTCFAGECNQEHEHEPEEE